MAIKSYAQQLEDVQAAIAAVEAGGQAVSFNGRAVNRGDLKTLYEREKWLRTKAAREARGGGVRIFQAVPRG